MLPHWTLSPDRLERLRELCLALPDASEKVAWGDPTWRVKDRIFAMQKGNYEGGRPSLWLKAASGAQEVLVGARPSVFFVPPYVGHKGWVGVYLDGAALEWEVVADLVVESWRLIAGPRLAAALPDAAPAQGAKRTGLEHAPTLKRAKRVPSTRSAKNRAKKKAPSRKAAPPRSAKKRTRAKR